MKQNALGWWRPWCALLLFGAACSVQAAPQSVLVKSREEGQGLLVKRGDACLLLTADHVVRGVERANTVGSVGASRFGEARLLVRFAEHDLAVLRVQGEVARDCGDPLEAYRVDLSRLLSQRPQGSMPFVFDSVASGAAGGLSRMAIVVTDLGTEWLRVQPLRATESIEQGRSGSLVMLNEAGADRPAGLLVSVNPEGEGKVLRLDRAVALVDRFFASPGAVASAQPPAAAVATREAAGNLLAVSAGARVARWSAQPSGPEYAPSNLLDGRSSASWNASFGRRPVDVDFQFAGGQVQTIGRIELVTARDQAAARAAREVEVFVSVDGSGWRSVHSGTLFQADAVKVIEFAPLRAAWLRVRIHDNWGDPNWVSLQQVRVYKP